MAKEDWREALEQAVSQLELQAKKGKKGRPDRYLARELLIALGNLVVEPDAEVEELRGRIEKAASLLGKAWDEALQDELGLACAEHVQAVDPRYLDLPNYDFDYTLAARERLEARLRAARFLGLPVSDELLRGVERADELLEPYRGRRGPRNAPGGGGREGASESDRESGPHSRAD